MVNKMSAYEKAVSTIPMIDTVISSIYSNIGYSKRSGEWSRDPNIDKFGFSVTSSEHGVSVGEMGSGYYGISSWYSNGSHLAYQYLAKAINSMQHQISMRAIQIAEGEKRELAKAAKEEAHRIISAGESEGTAHAG